MELVLKDWSYDWNENTLLQSDDWTESFFEEMVHGVRNEVGFQWISLYWVRDRDGSLMEVGITEHGFNMINDIQFENGNGLAGWVAKYQRPIVLRHVHRGQRFRSNPIKSFMCVPIIWEGKTKGVVNLGHIRPNHYSDRSLKKLLAYFELFFTKRILE
ncbi:MAG: GAF domain-containing protein [Calditrichaeota bacterium]|nr:GAF domain-containing protein [Calditrichota bacterium]